MRRAVVVLLASLAGACAHHAEVSPRPPAIASAAPALPPVDLRPRVEAALRDEVEPLRGKDDVTAYLERLHVRATARGQVTALEIEPGVAAIERLTPELGSEAAQEWVGRFVQSMTELSQRNRQSPSPHITR